MHPEKGVLELVRAWNSLPEPMRKEWHLRLVGPWREEEGGGGEDFLRKVKSEGNESVEIIDPIFDEKELIEQYRNARVFVYPSQAKTGETFGLAVLEAMSCGCVPLVSDLECFEDFLMDGHNGFQVKTQTKEWTGAFLEALKNMLDHAEMEQMSQDTYRTAQKYEIEQVATQFLADFEKLAAK